MHNTPKIAGLLLTGGGSTRLGRPKAALQINGRTLADRAAEMMGKVCTIALEVGPGHSVLPTAPEHPPFAGPLAAVAAGAAELSRLGWGGSALVLAVDMPFVSAELLDFLAAYNGGRDSVVPLADGKPQPLCARYSCEALAAAQRLAEEGVRSMMALLEEIGPCWIDRSEWGKVAGVEAFTDLDTEADLALTERLEGQAGEPPRRGVARADVVMVDGSVVKRRKDSLAAEEPMEIRASGPGQEPASVAITMRTPGHDFELAAGFLFTEGLLHAAGVSEIKYCEIPREEQQYNVVTVKLNASFDTGRLQRNFFANSSCGICGKASLDQLQVQCDTIPPGPVFARSVLQKMPEKLSRRQRVFEQTGGLHAAALFDRTGELLTLREDVGRHNACDKVIGNALLSGKVPARDLALFVSGRLSFEIVQKAAVAGVPLVGAVSAPSSLAVEAARTLGITLAGFVRADRFNLYTHPERVNLQD